MSGGQGGPSTCWIPGNGRVWDEPFGIPIKTTRYGLYITFTHSLSTKKLATNDARSTLGQSSHASHDTHSVQHVESRLCSGRHLRRTTATVATAQSVGTPAPAKKAADRGLDGSDGVGSQGLGNDRCRLSSMGMSCTADRNTLNGTNDHISTASLSTSCCAHMQVNRCWRLAVLYAVRILNLRCGLNKNVRIPQTYRTVPNSAYVRLKADIVPKPHNPFPQHARSYFECPHNLLVFDCLRLAMAVLSMLTHCLDFSDAFHRHIYPSSAHLSSKGRCSAGWTKTQCYIPKQECNTSLSSRVDPWSSRTNQLDDSRSGLALLPLFQKLWVLQLGVGQIDYFKLSSPGKILKTNRHPFRLDQSTNYYSPGCPLRELDLRRLLFASPSPKGVFFQGPATMASSFLLIDFPLKPKHVYPLQTPNPISPKMASHDLSAPCRRGP